MHTSIDCTLVHASTLKVVSIRSSNPNAVESSKYSAEPIPVEYGIPLITFALNEGDCNAMGTTRKACESVRLTFGIACQNTRAGSST